LHRFLHLGRGSFDQISQRKLRQLQQEMDGLVLLLVDEYSMLSDKILVALDKHLRRTFDISLPFGGISIIFTGDFHQLPPVLASPIYAILENGQIPEATAIWHAIPYAITLTVSQRHIGDPAYSQLLNRLRVGESTQADVSLINKHCVANPNATLEQFAYRSGGKYLCTVPTNKKVKIVNSTLLSCCKDPPVTIPAQHLLVVGELSKSMEQEEENLNFDMLTEEEEPEDEEQNDPVQKPLSKRKKARLTVDKLRKYHQQFLQPNNDKDYQTHLPPRITLSRNSRVILNANLAVSIGLVNSAMGTVYDIIFPSTPTPSPTEPQMMSNAMKPPIILVKFDREYYKGSSFIPEEDGIVPICAIDKTFTFNG